MLFVWRAALKVIMDLDLCREKAGKCGLINIEQTKSCLKLQIGRRKTKKKRRVAIISLRKTFDFILFVECLLWKGFLCGNHILGKWRFLLSLIMLEWKISIKSLFGLEIWTVFCEEGMSTPSTFYNSAKNNIVTSLLVQGTLKLIEKMTYYAPLQNRLPTYTLRNMLPYLAKKSLV